MVTPLNVPKLVRLVLIAVVLDIGLMWQVVFANPVVQSDFNGDGYIDLAIGVPGENVGGIVNAGAVHILYGSTGSIPAGDQVWHLNSPNVPLDAASGDRFGEVVAAGDFNDDGYADLAVGIPNKDNATGQVIVMYGGAQGVSATGSQVWNQDILEDTPESDDRFGAALVAGDFNADGYDDLAIGVPGEDFPDIGPPEANPPHSICTNGICTNAGIVNLVYGSAAGLTVTRNELWHQDRGVSFDGWVEWQDCFGSSLAAGDFNADGADDLAVGAPCEHTGGDAVPPRNNGGVSVYYGKVGVGLTGNKAQYIRQWSNNVVGYPQANDAFGYALAAGDFNGDGFDDLAVGVPGEDEDTTGVADVGAVAVFYGRARKGLNISVLSGNDLFFRYAMGLGSGLKDMRWGMSLASGDFNLDGFADLAVGAPMDDVAGATDAGSVSILYGSASRFSGIGNRLITQNTPDMADGAQAYDWFAHTLTTGDFNGDGVPRSGRGGSLRGYRWGREWRCGQPAFRGIWLWHQDGKQSIPVPGQRRPPRGFGSWRPVWRKPLSHTVQRSMAYDTRG